MITKVVTTISAVAAFVALALVGLSLQPRPTAEAHQNDVAGKHYAVLHAEVKSSAISNSAPLPLNFDAERRPGIHNERLAKIQRDIANDVGALTDPDNEICLGNGRPAKTNGAKNVPHLYCEKENVQGRSKNIFERTQGGCCYTRGELGSDGSKGARIGYLSGSVDGEHMIVVAQMDCRNGTIHGKWPLATSYSEYNAGDFIDRTLSATRGRPKGAELLQTACAAAGF